MKYEILIKFPGDTENISFGYFDEDECKEELFMIARSYNSVDLKIKINKINVKEVF